MSLVFEQTKTTPIDIDEQGEVGDKKNDPKHSVLSIN